MSSSILRSDFLRKLSWVVAALLGFVVIELTVATLHPSNLSERRNFLEMRWNQPETPDRLFIERKIDLFGETEPDIVQVGDSSGFHGVQPPIVESFLPGFRYLNMSAFASQGYEGYFETARYMFDHNSHIRALVLYVTPAGHQPRSTNVSGGAYLGEAIRREFNDPFYRALAIPSLALRHDVTSFVYYGTRDPARLSWMMQSERYPEADLLFQLSAGWTREHDSRIGFCPSLKSPDGCDDVAEHVLPWGRRVSRLRSPTDDEVVHEIAEDFGSSARAFDWNKLTFRKLTFITFDKFRDLARAHGARLIISSAPISEVFEGGYAGAKISSFARELADYARENPDVSVIPPTFWPDDHFSSPVHVSTPYTSENSRRLGRALASVLEAHGIEKHPPKRAPSREKVTALKADSGFPGYGFGAPVLRDDVSFRGIRDGRNEALVFANVAPSTTIIRVKFAPGADEGATSQLTLAANGAPLPRVKNWGEPNEAAWRLSGEAMRYSGWLELLLSTRGATSWPGDQLAPDAKGPRVLVSDVMFN